MTIVDRRYSVAEGQAVKSPCRVATTANITLSGEQTIDGVAVVADDRVLVKDQSTGSENGIYSCSTGNWTRTRDFDGAYDIVTGTRVFVTDGATSGEIEFFVNTAGPIVVETTSIEFTSIISTAVSAAAATAAALGLSWTTGDIKLTIKTVADTGWRLFDDGTIGDASSGATYANVAALALFTLMYDNFSDANCAITTNAGGATTRAAQTNPATAWAAHCRIALPKTLGRALGIAGAGSGLTSRVLGVVAGSETHTLTAAESAVLTYTAAVTDPGHTHAVTGGTKGASGTFNSAFGGGGQAILIPPVDIAVSSATTGITAGVTANAGGGAHTSMQPTIFINAMIKL